jgi:hypothetical protein
VTEVVIPGKLKAEVKEMISYSFEVDLIKCKSYKKLAK